MPTGVPGIRHTDNFATNVRPQNWRELILHLWPRGRAPITAMLSRAKKERTSDPIFHWWEELLPEQGGAVTNVYINASMLTTYNYTSHQATSGVAGATIYVKVAAAVANEIRPGHELLLRDESDHEIDIVGKVTAVTPNGANSRIDVQLLEDDDNATTPADTASLQTVDNCVVIGSINPEDGEKPSAIAYDPTERTNYTQIFRTAVDLSRTARKTRTRTGDAYKELRRQALQMHSVEMERALLHGILSANTGANGLPERTMWGIIPYIKEFAPAANVTDYTKDSDYSGAAWIASGSDWLNAVLEVLFRVGSGKKTAYCGSGALLGIQVLAEALGQINLQVGADAFGIKVTKWVTPFGDVDLVTHPLFSYNATTRNSMLVIEPEMFKVRLIDDTFFRKDNTERQGGPVLLDGTHEEWVTELGYEIHHPSTAGWLNGVGQLNVV